MPPPVLTFTSRHLPQPGQSLARLRQDYAVRHYIWLGLGLFVAMMSQMRSGGTLLWIAGLGMPLALGLANLLADFEMHGRWVRVVFVGNSFVLRSAADEARQPYQHPADADNPAEGAPLPEGIRPNELFPLAYAVAELRGQQLTFHYHDRVVRLLAEDWQHFGQLVHTLRHPHLRQPAPTPPPPDSAPPQPPTIVYVPIG